MITNNDIKQWIPLVHKIVNRIHDYTFEYKSYIDWDEIEQAGLIGLYRALKGYDKSKGDFKNYAITAITRAIYRQLIFDRRMESHSDIDNFYNIEDEKIVPVHYIEDEVFIKLLLQYIDRLPIQDKSKKILKLRLAGYSLKDISNKLGITYQAVGDVIKNHKGKIKKYIEEVY